MQLLRLLIVIVLTVLTVTVGFAVVAAVAVVGVVYFLTRWLMLKFGGKKQPAAGAAPRRNVASSARGDVIEVEATEIPAAPPPALEK